MATDLLELSCRELPNHQSPLKNPQLMSSPVRRSPQKTNIKIRRSPTITPKRFGRFFTPRTSLQRVTRFHINRLVLGDITASAANTKQGKRHLPSKEHAALADDPPKSGLLGCKDVPIVRKRKTLHCPEATPEKLKPVKRTRCRSVSTSTEIENASYDADADINRYYSEDGENSHESIQIPPRPIIRSRFRGALGTVSLRELDLPPDTSRPAKTRYGAGMG